ncbi:hypothetical protein [Kaistia terrae]|uniref:XRE family transcriptional regulator n=1 Tax=Kaistia terrae TaxID=537017 RepID=A0ABW0Q003_9HYPH|nr:hypothetical protein [Kaistia terrae]MCX5578989.1 hypothetical protein [Kaistia terrae]
MPPEKHSPVCRYIEEYVEKSTYSLQEIAMLCGFKDLDIIYRFLRGERRLPLHIVETLAEVLECNRSQLFILTLRTWFDEDFLSLLEESFGAARETEAERSWLEALREIYKGDVPEITATMRRRIRILAG